MTYDDGPIRKAVEAVFAKYGTDLDAFYADVYAELKAKEKREWEHETALEKKR